MRFASFLLLAIIPTAMAGQSTPPRVDPQFNVLVLDALNGKPQAGFEVFSICEGKGISKSDFEQAKITAENGVAQIPFRCDSDRKIELSVTLSHASNNYQSTDIYQKGECGSMRPISLQEILTAGSISDPTGAGNYWCPTKISKKMKPVPGQVVIFVKKPTWWQVHVAG